MRLPRLPTPREELEEGYTCECGHAAPAGSNFCPKCGQDRDHGSEAASVRSRRLSIRVERGELCRCGTMFVHGAQFCQQCGEERYFGEVPDGCLRSRRFSSGRVDFPLEGAGGGFSSNSAGSGKSSIRSSSSRGALLEETEQLERELQMMKSERDEALRRLEKLERKVAERTLVEHVAGAWIDMAEKFYIGKKIFFYKDGWSIGEFFSEPRLQWDTSDDEKIILQDGEQQWELKTTVGDRLLIGGCVNGARVQFELTRTECIRTVIAPRLNIYDAVSASVGDRDHDHDMRSPFTVRGFDAWTEEAVLKATATEVEAFEAECEQEAAMAELAAERLGELHGLRGEARAELAELRTAHEEASLRQREQMLEVEFAAAVRTGSRLGRQDSWLGGQLGLHDEGSDEEMREELAELRAVEAEQARLSEDLQHSRARECIEATSALLERQAAQEARSAAEALEERAVALCEELRREGLERRALLQELRESRGSMAEREAGGPAEARELRRACAELKKELVGVRGAEQEAYDQLSLLEKQVAQVRADAASDRQGGEMEAAALRARLERAELLQRGAAVELEQLAQARRDVDVLQQECTLARGEIHDVADSTRAEARREAEALRHECRQMRAAEQQASAAARRLQKTLQEQSDAIGKVWRECRAQRCA
ncbi:unnamed protein product [Prorocentrum cordatum]|nr:unnamed protein product [Polarella glacialis]